MDPPGYLPWGVPVSLPSSMRKDVTYVVGALTLALVMCIGGVVACTLYRITPPPILEHSITAALAALAALLARTDKGDLANETSR